MNEISMPNCCYSCSNDCNGCVKEIVNAQTLLRAVYFEGNTAFFEKQESPKNRLYSEFCIYICNVAFRFAINHVSRFGVLYSGSIAN